MTKEELRKDPDKVVRYIGHIPSEWVADRTSVKEILDGVKFLIAGHHSVEIVRVQDQEDRIVGYTRGSKDWRGKDMKLAYGEDVYLIYKKRNTIDGRDFKLEHWVELLFNDSLDNIDYDGYLS